MSPFDYAIEKCKETPHRRGYSRHFCVISTKKGKVISEGRNSYYKTHPLTAKASKRAGKPEKQCICAEVAALLKDRYRKGYRLTVVRLDSKDNPCLSQPCVTCIEVLKSFENIKVVEFST